MTGEMKVINFPFSDGRWNDITIFRSLLMQNLEISERVKAYDGYAAKSP